MRPSIEDRFPRPSVVGVVNVTPDSFSDGGVNYRPGDAIATARRLVEEGAALVDVGGELRRVVPVLEAIAGEVPASVDTSKAEVARRAIDLGAVMVNDVTALRA